MNVLIIEDEAPAVRKLTNHLKKLDNSITILADIDTVEEGIEWLKNNTTPDLIFSDIQLADGISFSIYEAITPDCPIIFTTAYDEYAIKAFELNSVDYLLKPYTEEQLSKALTKFKKNTESEPDVENFQKALDLIKSSKTDNKEYKSRFLISKADALIPVKTQDIACFFTEDKAVMLITKTGESYFINYTLDELEEVIDPRNFFRLNRQYLANVDVIQKINHHFHGKLSVNIGKIAKDDVIVSRAKANLFKEWIEGS